MKRREEGSITVFLSLIMLLVLSILMTTIEVARVSSYQVQTNRALVAAMDSVLADFHYPLYDEYHVFALDGSNVTSTNVASNNVTNTNVTSNIDKEQIEYLVTEYMDYTFVPDKNLKENLGEVLDYMQLFQYFNLYGINTKDIQVVDITTLLDYDGEYFRTQAVDYMKYATFGNGLDFILEALIPIEETKTTRSIVKEKQKVEESIGELEEYILELMSYIDGIKVGIKGVSVNRGGYLNVNNSFVKKICPYDITMESTKINNEWVFASLKNEYINPNVYIQNQMTWISGLKYTMEKKLEARVEYRFYKLINTESIKDKKKLEELQEKIIRLEKQIEEYGNQESSYIQNINREHNRLKTLVSNTMNSIELALKVIDKVIEKQKIVSNSINEYEIYLNQQKSEISESLYESLLEEFSVLSQYKASENDTSNDKKNGGKYDFIGMKETLLTNKILLESILFSIDTDLTNSESSLSIYSTMLSSTQEKISKYSFKNLNIDYTSMQKPVESESFFARIKGVFDTGVMGLVLEDTSKLSKKEISSEILPSKLLGIKESSDPEDITNIIKDSNLGSGQDTFDQVSKGFESSTKDFDGVINLTNNFSEALLFTAYLGEHFNHYNYDSLEETKKNLEYELEYILMGKKTDIKNMNGVIMKILLIRSMINLGTIMFHKETTLKATEIATLFLGFTGIPVLVGILKVLLLVILSVVESLVDVAAMLIGKKLPLLKTGQQLQVSIEDLFVLSKSMILDKANKMNNPSNKLELGYVEYLYLLLFLENNKDKSYRALDLIQENIRTKYDDNFYIKNCIQRFAIEGTFEMNKKFVTMPFIHNILQDVYEKYQYKILQEYSY